MRKVFFSLYSLIIFFDIEYNQKNKVNLPLAVNISVSQLCLLMAINIRMLSKLFGKEKYSTAKNNGFSNEEK